MKSIHLKSHIDNKGILRLETPVQGIIDEDVEVMLVIESQPGSAKFEKKEAKEWPLGFFEKTAGAWQGEPLTRPPQGEYERREDIE